MDNVGKMDREIGKKRDNLKANPSHHLHLLTVPRSAKNPSSS